VNRGKVLFKNTFIYIVGTFGSKTIGFFLLPFYTHYLSRADYGYLGIISTTVALAIPLITFQIFDGLYRYLLGKESKEKISKIISSSFFRILLNLLIFDALYLIFVHFISFKYQYLILFQINFSIFSSFFLQSARGLKKNLAYSVSGIISTIVTCFFSIILIVFYNMRVDGIIIAQIMGSISISVFLNAKVKVFKFIRPRFIDLNISKGIIKYSIPLIPNVLSWWIMNLSDRYMIVTFKGLEANGIYAVANKFPGLLLMANSIFYLAWQESAITEYDSKDKNDYYTKVFNVFMLLEFSVIFILLSSTKFIMSIMVDEKFFSAWQYTPFLYFGAMFSAFSSFYGSGYLSSKETKGAFTTSVLGASINIGINLLLIPIIGIQAASLSTMIAFLGMWIARLFQTKRYFVIKINKTQLLLMIGLSVFFTVSFYVSKGNFNYLIFALSVIIFWFCNKNLLLKGVNYVKYFRSSEK